jgi:hypothetical protein
MGLRDSVHGNGKPRRGRNAGSQRGLGTRPRLTWMLSWLSLPETLQCEVDVSTSSFIAGQPSYVRATVLRAPCVLRRTPSSAPLSRTDVAEDRLTEVLACVADVNQRFARELGCMAGVKPREGERYAVGTQRGTPSGRRVDLELGIYQGLRRTGLVWIEVKEEAVFQPNQLRDYAEQVRDPVHGEPNGKVLTITPPGRALPEIDTAPGAPQWEAKDWSEVALAADQLGREWGRAEGERRWRRAAMERSAETQWRYLAELVSHLEEKGYARMEPLTAEDVVAARRVEAFLKALDSLIRAVRDDIDGVTRKRNTRRVHAYGAWQHFVPTEPKWFSDPERFAEAYPELLYWPEDTLTPDRRDAPVFFAGLTFSKPSDDTLYALADEEWQRRLPDGFTVSGDKRYMHVFRAKYLSQLIVAGGTFDEQARALKEWVTEAFSDIMDKVEVPPRRLPSDGGVTA